MTNLNNRIYQELNEWKYSESILTEYFISEKRKLKILNSLLIAISLIGITGWFKLGEYKLFWLFLLLLTQGLRMLQNTLFTSNDDLFNIKNSISFYSYNILDLEQLYYDYHSLKYKDKTIESKFIELKEQERALFGQQKFDKINPKQKLIKKAEIQTDMYLNKIIKNVSHE